MLFKLTATACLVSSALAGNLIGYASRYCIGTRACVMNAVPCCGNGLAEVCDDVVRSWDAEDHNIILYKQDHSYFGVVYHYIGQCFDDPSGLAWYACAAC